jgi:hypothetical protein
MTDAAIPGRTSVVPSSSRTRTGKAVTIPIAATPTSVTVAENSRSGRASKRTRTRDPSSTCEMRTSGIETSTSIRDPDVR